MADLNKLYDSPHPTKASGSDGRDDGGDHGKIPYFDLEFSPNVTAVLAKTAILNCRVKDIGNKTVSLYFSLEVISFVRGRSQLPHLLELVGQGHYEADEFLMIDGDDVGVLLQIAVQ